MFLILLIAVLLFIILVNSLHNLLDNIENTIEYLIIDIVAGLFILLIANMLLKEFSLILSLFSFLLYYSLNGIKKMIITLVASQHDLTIKKENYKVTYNFILLYILSPDLLFTSWNKVLYKHETKRIIKDFNLVNLIIMLFLFGLSILSVYFYFDYLFQKLLTSFLYIRFISRSIEIMVSFIKDIIDKEEKSGLELGDRIKLCFLSVLEMSLAILSINILLNEFYPSNDTLINYVIIVLSGFVNGIDLGGKDIYNFAQVFYEITTFSLLGTVLSSYVGRKKENKGDYR